MIVNHRLFIQNKEFPSLISAKYIARYNHPAKMEIQLAFYDELLDTNFSVGDKVLFMRGYGQELVNRFVGYIESVTENQPFTLTCYDKLHFLRKEDIPDDEFSESTDREILDKIFVQDSGKGSYNSDLRTVNLDFRVNTELSYSQLPSNITKGSVLDILSTNGGWQYYADFENKLVIEKPYTRSHNINEITEEDIIARTYNIKEKIPETVNVRLISVNSKTKEVLVRESDFVEGARLIERKLVDVDEIAMMDRIKTIIEKHKQHTLEGDFSITGGVNGKVVAVNVGNVLHLNYKDDGKQIYVEGVEETFDYKDKIKQKILLRSVVE